MSYDGDSYTTRRHFRDVPHALARTVDPTVELLATWDAMQHVRWSPEVSNDTGDDAANSDFANTTNPLTVTSAVTTYTACDFVAGKLFKLDSEVVEVYEVSGNDVTFTRGVADTAVASHADAVSIYTATDADDEFRRFAKAAREQLEEDTERSFLTQTWALYLDRWPHTIELHRPPVQSITSIAYLDAAGDSQTWASANYTSNLNRWPAYIEPAYGIAYPVLRDTLNAVTVTFVAGEGDDRTDVAERALQACRMLVASQYCEREATGDPQPYLQVYERLVSKLSWRSPV